MKAMVLLIMILMIIGWAVYSVLIALPVMLLFSLTSTKDNTDESSFITTLIAGISLIGVLSMKRLGGMVSWEVYLLSVFLTAFIQLLIFLLKKRKQNNCPTIETVKKTDNLKRSSYNLMENFLAGQPSQSAREDVPSESVENERVDYVQRLLHTATRCEPNKELNRNDKALAETAALLILKKMGGEYPKDD